MTPEQEKALARGVMTLLRDAHQRARNETPSGFSDPERPIRIKTLGQNAVRDYKAIAEAFELEQ